MKITSKLEQEEEEKNGEKKNAFNASMWVEQKMDASIVAEIETVSSGNAEHGDNIKKKKNVIKHKNYWNEMNKTTEGKKNNIQ